MYRVKYSKQVVKFLQKQKGEVKVKIIGFFDDIKKKANFENYDVKKLKGFNNVFRLRISKFRIIFSIDQEQSLIKVIKASSRGDVYKC